MCPGLEVTSGSLGHGLSVGVGLALAAKRRRSGQLVYAIVGDGEMNEGSIWEALLFAAHFKLDNLVVIVDENRFQAMGSTDEVMNLGNIEAKLTAFDFECLSIDGHDEACLDAAFTTLKASKNGKPKAIVARTVKGYGVSFMEANNMWHYTRLTDETYKAAPGRAGAMRAKFSRLLTDAALADDRVLLLTGDHGYALFDEFRRECPGQYVNCGVAEQNMVGVAAGLAKGGFRPIVYGLSAFVPMRVLEQIKIDICYESLPVMLVGDGAGVVYSQLGASHQSTEDIAALRPLPNLEIFAPADKFELPYCFQHMLTSGLPGYLRFGKADLGDIHQTVPTAPIGDLLPVKAGTGEAAILATGSMVKTALAVAGEMPVVEARLRSAPFNAAQLASIAAGYQTIFVLEEHSTAGGFGALVAETLSSRQPTRVIRIGTEKFSELCGTYAYLMSYHGIAAADVARKIEAALETAA